MLYFDRLQEEHFGSIKQQIWSFMHFFLHTVLVLVLQGIANFILWRQAIDSVFSTDAALSDAVNPALDGTYTNGSVFTDQLWDVSYNFVYSTIYGVDETEKKNELGNAYALIEEGYDNFGWKYLASNGTSGNETAFDLLVQGLDEMYSTVSNTIFESLSITLPKKKEEAMKAGEKVDSLQLLNDYSEVFGLVFVYVFIAVSLPMKNV